VSFNEQIEQCALCCAFSESSMFITRNRFILKTCGKTTLLAAIKPLLELVYEKCGFDIILARTLTFLYIWIVSSFSMASFGDCECRWWFS